MALFDHKGVRSRSLTEQVKEVRRKYDGGTMTVKEIADLYDVGKTTVYRALEKTKPQEQKKQEP
ncbi:MAG: helix-turn-helix domain-containing protein [Bifidobacterium sp.]|nr:helix-turn-helix domain-containing protein [Bifidobacterium sp.]